MGKTSIEQLEIKANDIRRDIIKMLEEAGSGHSAGPLGLTDIFTAFYFDILNHDPKNPNWDERDFLLLSNGHCVPVQYATMAHAGYFPKEELSTLRKFGSRLQGHPERTKLPGLENTSGPLGSGLSQGCGIALGLRMNNDLHRWVYVVTGDGEQNERCGASRRGGRARRRARHGAPAALRRCDRAHRPGIADLRPRPSA